MGKRTLFSDGKIPHRKGVNLPHIISKSNVCGQNLWMGILRGGGRMRQSSSKTNLKIELMKNNSKILENEKDVKKT